jgi:hypothetical protein
LVPALSDEHVRSELGDATERHDLVLGEYLAQPNEASVAFHARFEDGELVIRDLAGAEHGRGWDALQARLQALPTDVWHDLHLYRTWPAREAIERGRDFAAGEITPLLSDLAKVYLDVVGPALPSGKRGYGLIESRSTADGRPAVRFEVTAHAIPGHFHVPRQATSQLGLEPDDPVELWLEGPGLSWHGVTRMASGTEVYYRVNDSSTHGLESIGSYMRLRVIAAKPHA